MAQTENEVVSGYPCYAEKDVATELKSDFGANGVCAVVVDKDRNLKWAKRDIIKVTAEEVGKFFEPLVED
ncbi:hypothetical protein PsorP6_000821 [Peronosclerospora sorghi]|uniref:Uncharacterized protein n=1 Tax=Peronosclerospora sorghi TaxID=230839 RepID=A0ACC0WSG5_9STRA|nr:hypothetical protein PsorP6_000821 [Peronosclerospora sorghi]